MLSIDIIGSGHVALLTTRAPGTRASSEDAAYPRINGSQQRAKSITGKCELGVGRARGAGYRAVLVWHWVGFAGPFESQSSKFKIQSSEFTLSILNTAPLSASLGVVWMPDDHGTSARQHPASSRPTIERTRGKQTAKDAQRQVHQFRNRDQIQLAWSERQSTPHRTGSVHDAPRHKNLQVEPCQGYWTWTR
jgi:hypothetical protein